MVRKATSRLSKALARSTSLRTTVPKVVADVLELDPRDTLEWRVNPASNGVWVTKGPPEATADNPPKKRRRT